MDEITLLAPPEEYPFEFFLPDLHPVADVVRWVVAAYGEVDASPSLPPTFDKIALELNYLFLEALMNRALAIDDVFFYGNSVKEEYLDGVAKGKYSNIWGYIEDNQCDCGEWHFDRDEDHEYSFQQDLQWVLDSVGLCYASYDGNEQEDYDYYDGTHKLIASDIQVFNGPIKGVW